MHSVIVLGICAAVILFIRANNAAIVLCAFLLLLFTERDQRIKVLTGTSIGFMGVAVLVISFFYLSGGYDYVSNMLYGTIFYNLEYAANKISSGSMFGSIRFIYIISLALVLGALYVIKKEERNTRMIVYIVVCFLLSFLTMGKNNFAHYLIVIIPLFALLSSLAIPKAHVHLASITFIIVAALFMKFPVGMVHSVIVNRPINEKFYTEADAVISRIPHDERTKIWNYSTIYSAPSILYRNGIVQCNRIFHNFQLDFSEKLREECENELPIKSPAWIIIDGSSNVSAQDSMYIADNYQLDEIVSSNDMNLNVMFYKRK